MSLNIIARKDYEDLQKNILNEKEQENKKSCLSPFFPFFYKFSKGDGNNRIYDVKGDDTYVASHGDIINDSDNLGKIIFEGETLSTAIYDESKRVYVLEFEDKKLVA